MRFFNLSFIFFILVWSCTTQKEQTGEVRSEEEETVLSFQEEASVMNNFTIVQTDSVEFEKTKFTDNPFINDASLITVLKDGISLSIDNSENMILKDSITEYEAENFNYHFEGYNESLKQYLIAQVMYEDERIFLVDKSSGKITTLWNRPIPDAQGRFIFNKQSNESLVYDYDLPFGFQIWEKQADSLTRVEEVRLKHNIIIDGKWTPSGTLFIKSLPISEFLTKGEEATSGLTYYKILKKVK
ncbi:MAG: hypothetical protein J7604_24330 [Sporocytophaga sp.]|uniref:hypothetical protein n=1 Tax=Sporocytophaga sp. TaxID=2231183 RepID=UPI001B0DF7A4|nr:hypothetical protein [Sporocytophaga sp.]MBO9703362.1 hypothetical protein [Sporocytophaga sp.]